MRDDLVADSCGRNFVQPQLQVLADVVEEYIDRRAGRRKRIDRPVEHDLRSIQFRELRSESGIVQCHF